MGFCLFFISVTSAMVIYRRLQCVNNSEPQNGHFARMCRQQPCPTWSNWNEWSICSTSCGGGETRRERICLNYDPENPDSHCYGNKEEVDICNTNICPHYHEWSSWEVCSVTCGEGVQRRHRICHKDSEVIKCEGDETEERSCGSLAYGCPEWSSWSEYGFCSVSCGDGGTRVSTRTCLNSADGITGCVGKASRVQSCNTQPCPRWTQWTEWSFCTATCGGGTSNRVRVCEYGEIGDIGCEGEDREVETCNTNICATWRDWGNWGPCSASCDKGMRTRKRTCDGGDVGDIGCEGPVSEDQECINDICSMWSQWGEYGECSRTCGKGVRRRARLCAAGAIGDEGCKDGDELETIPCDLDPCPRCDIDFTSFIFDNGRVQCNKGNNVGSMCRFTCGQDYQLAGIRTITCDQVEDTEFAIWSADKPPTCNKKCSDEADIVFVIDSSSSIKAFNFAIVRSFIRTVVDQFKVGSDAARFGAIRYNRDVFHLWNLNEYDTKADILNAVTNIPYDGSGTHTGKAINYTAENMFTAAAGHRPGVPKIAVVITDGVSYDDVATPTRKLKSENVLVVSVGIGEVNLKEIELIASDPDENFATTVTDFGSLEKVVNVISDQIKLCQPLPELADCPPQAMMDLLFIVDSSSSIGRDNFNIMREFILEIVNTFNINEESAQVGIIRYNRIIDEVLRLNDHSSVEGVNDAIENMRYSGRGTQTGKALSHAATTALSPAGGRRPGIKAVTIVLTDGKSQDDIELPAMELQDKSVVIAVGIKNANVEELQMIATGDGETNVFNVEEFSALNGIVGNIAKAVCFASRDGMMKN